MQTPGSRSIKEFFAPRAGTKGSSGGASSSTAPPPASRMSTASYHTAVSTNRKKVVNLDSSDEECDHPDLKTPPRRKVIDLDTPSTSQQIDEV